VMTSCRRSFRKFWRSIALWARFARLFFFNAFSPLYPRRGRKPGQGPTGAGQRCLHGCSTHPQAPPGCTPRPDCEPRLQCGSVVDTKFDSSNHGRALLKDTGLLQSRMPCSQAKMYKKACGPGRPACLALDLRLSARDAPRMRKYRRASRLDCNGARWSTRSSTAATTDGLALLTPSLSEAGIPASSIR
jgi:hypothetical protein